MDATPNTFCVCHFLRPYQNEGLAAKHGLTGCIIMRQSVRPLANICLIGTSTTLFLPFLCPALLVRSSSTVKNNLRVKQTAGQLTPKYPLCSSAGRLSSPASASISPFPIARPLPTTCPGCGALSQTVELKEAGYYSITRGAVKSFLGLTRGEKETASAGPILAQLDERTRQQYGFEGLLSSRESIS